MKPLIFFLLCALFVSKHHLIESTVFVDVVVIVKLQSLPLVKNYWRRKIDVKSFHFFFIFSLFHQVVNNQPRP